MRNLIPLLGQLRSVGFSGLLGGAIFPILASYLELEWDFVTAITTGSMLGVGLDLFVERTVVGFLTITLLNTLYLNFIFFLLRPIYGKERADSFRQKAVDSQQRRLSSLLSQDSQASNSLLQAISELNQAIGKLDSEVEYLFDLVNELDEKANVITCQLETVNEEKKSLNKDLQNLNNRITNIENVDRS